MVDPYWFWLDETQSRVSMGCDCPEEGNYQQSLFVEFGMVNCVVETIHLGNLSYPV